ncbi:MAG: hypothetical protein IJF71_00320 [Clostridia bacterium]|nr:hypothetical protein [Clostridia bacterium]
MKKRRFAIVAFLLCACICLGVGYAALTDTLTINGDITVKPHNADFVVEFTEVKSSDKTTTAIQTDKTVANFSSTQLSAAGDTATAILEVQNKSTGYKAQMADFGYATSTPLTETYFTYKVEYVEETGVGVYSVIAAPLLGVNETCLVRVTVTLVTQPVEEIAYKFTLTATATAVTVA